MKYGIELKPQAVKDLKNVPRRDIERILVGIEILADDCKGDVKQLTSTTTEYRLRIGNYRILFEIEQDDKIIIYRILRRKDAYRKRK